MGDPQPTTPTACPTTLTAAAVLDTLSAFALIFLNKILDQKKKKILIDIEKL